MKEKSLHGLSKVSQQADGSQLLVQKSNAVSPEKKEMLKDMLTERLKTEKLQNPAQELRLNRLNPMVGRAIQYAKKNVM